MVHDSRMAGMGEEWVFSDTRFHDWRARRKDGRWKESKIRGTDRRWGPLLSGRSVAFSLSYSPFSTDSLPMASVADNRGEEEGGMRHRCAHTLVRRQRSRHGCFWAVGASQNGSRHPKPDPRCVSGMGWGERGVARARRARMEIGRPGLKQQVSVAAGRLVR